MDTEVTYLIPGDVTAAMREYFDLVDETADSISDGEVTAAMREILKDTPDTEGEG